MSINVARLVAEEAAGHHALPMPTWVFGVLALVAFAALLGVTWSFRGAAQKYASPRAGGHGSADAGHDGAGGAHH